MTQIEVELPIKIRQGVIAAVGAMSSAEVPVDVGDECVHLWTDTFEILKKLSVKTECTVEILAENAPHDPNLSLIRSWKKKFGRPKFRFLEGLQ